MSIDFYNSIDIIFFSCIILLVIIIHALINRENLQLSARYRTILAFIILVILLCDLVSRIHFPMDKQTEHIFRYILNFVYLVLQPLPVSLGLMYLFSLFREKRYSRSLLLIFLIPFFAGCAVMIYSIFTGFVFFIDENNIYHRGPGMFVFAITNYSFIIPSAWLVFHHRDIIKRQTILIIIAYSIIPTLGSLLQLLFYGIITAWPSFAVALFIIFIFIEGRRSDRDYLTGLLNRQSFDARIHGRIEQYNRKGSFSFVVIDLDKFKTINDTYGHDKGDEVLQTVGGILTHSVSVSDTVARYGGDEFVIIIESADKKIVENILERIDRNLSAWNDKNGNTFVLSLSAGYVIYDPGIHKGFEDLFRHADSIMFDVKDNRR